MEKIRIITYEIMSPYRIIIQAMHSRKDSFKVSLNMSTEVCQFSKTTEEMSGYQVPKKLDNPTYHVLRQDSVSHCPDGSIAAPAPSGKSPRKLIMVHFKYE